MRYQIRSSSCIKSPYNLWRENPRLFAEYQRLQGKSPFKVGNWIASFVKTPQKETLFIGMFKINNVSIAPQGTIDLCTGLDCAGFNLYDIVEVDNLKEFAGRLSIDWGRGYLSWYQIANRHNKSIREIKIKFEEDNFPGYFLFRCKLSEINTMPKNWIGRLSSARGVYILISFSSGEHYVGSAAGQGGFFQRWQQHAAAGGSSVGLQAHGAVDYQVAILQVASGFESDADIVEIEHSWMDKLQTRGMGLNGQPRVGDSDPPQRLP